MTDSKSKATEAKTDVAAEAASSLPQKRAELSYTGAGYLIATVDGEKESSGVVTGLATAILEAVRLDSEGYEVRATVDQYGNFAVLRFEEAEEA